MRYFALPPFDAFDCSFAWSGPITGPRVPIDGPSAPRLRRRYNQRKMKRGVVNEGGRR